MGLPASYTPGKYRVGPRGEYGFTVLTPAGTAAKLGPYSSRSSAQTVADDLNLIRQALAPRKKTA